MCTTTSLSMDSWLNRGAGFASSSEPKRALRKETVTDSHHRNNSHSCNDIDSRNKCDWKHDEFLHSFSLKKKFKDNQEIAWSESSSDDEEKVKIKREPEKRIKTETEGHQDSCQIKRRMCQRRKRRNEVKKSFSEIPLSRRVLVLNNSRQNESQGTYAAECTYQPSSQSGHAETLDVAQISKFPSPQNTNDSTAEVEAGESGEIENVKVKSERMSTKDNFNKWTSSTFDSPVASTSFQSRMKNKRKRSGETCSNEILSPEGRLESPQLDIEDCVSSSSDNDIPEKHSSVDDDGIEDEEEMCSSLNEESCETKDKLSAKMFLRKSPSLLQKEGQTQDWNSQKVSAIQSLEMHRIRMSDVDSPVSDTSQLQISGMNTPGSDKSSQKMGASDWASIFQRQVSPPREKQTVLVTEDSGKKKKKYASKSLTAQLARLVSREKSAVRFWNHSLSTCANQEKPKKNITVKIISMSRQFSFLVCKCEVLAGQLPLSSVCKVLLLRSAIEKLNLQCGTKLQIFAPWQQLDDGRNATLLCTNYLQVLSDTDAPAVDHHSHPSTVPQNLPTSIVPTCLGHNDLRNREVSSEKNLHLKWSCPCSLDKSMPASSCPASKPESNPLEQVFQATVPSPQTVTLHSITSSAPSSSSSSSHQRTLLESIEKAHQNRDCLPSFSAFVLKAFRVKGSDDSKASLSLLLEDMSGSLALVSHSEEDRDKVLVDSSYSRLVTMEGKRCLCQDLSVQARISKDKDPSLFSVIGQSWLKRKPAIASQENLNQESPNFQLKVPSFCYALQSSTSDPPKLLLSNDQEQPRNIDLIQLERLAQEGVSHRFSALVTLFDLTGLFQPLRSRRLLVCDPFDVKEFSTVRQLVISDDCINVCRIGQDPVVSPCLLRDVTVKDGRVHCDKYSSVVSQSCWTILGLDNKLDFAACDSAVSHSPQLPPLTCSAQPGDVVGVEGSILMVDEEASFSWEACDKCGNEISHISRHTRVMCAACHQQVEKTVSKLKMTVMISIEHFPSQTCVKVSLNEETIMSVLPNEMDEEGYDVDQVLGKSVKASVCVVKSCTSSQIILEQLEN